jgi:hypothetical protein
MKSSLVSVRAGWARCIARDTKLGRDVAIKILGVYVETELHVAESSNWRVQKLILHPKTQTTTASR